MGRCGTGWVAAAAVAALPWSVVGQTCSAGERVGSLGITGIECERCRFETEGGRTHAVFWTEPVIRGLDPAARSSETLREGDAIVAVGGALITTARGQEAYSTLPRSGDVAVRVRREGQIHELRVPVMAVCPSPRGLAPVVAGREIPVPPVPPVTPSAPKPRATATAPAVPRAATPPALPLAPEPPGPDVRLGFGFRCGPCSSTRSGGSVTWSFGSPLEVTGVQRGGPAWEAGMRPGDRIVGIGGVDVMSAEGGRRFAGIRPGDRISWTLEREGETVEVISTAESHEPVHAPTGGLAPPAPAPALADVLRFSGRVGNALVEVRGGRVTVLEEGSEIVIRTGDAEIRVRVAGGAR